MFAKWDFVRLERVQLGKRVCYRAYPNRAGEEDHTDTIHMGSSGHSERPDGSRNQQGLNAENSKGNSPVERPHFPLISCFKGIAAAHRSTATEIKYKGIFFLFSPVYSLCPLTALFRNLVSLFTVLSVHTTS